MEKWNDAPIPEGARWIEVEDIHGRRFGRVYPNKDGTWMAWTGEKWETEVYVEKWRYHGPPVPTKKQQGRAVILWEWNDAPGELRDLSDHGGDEDYVALSPTEDDHPWWMESGSSFGRSGVSYFTLDDGRCVAIGAHA